MKDGLKKVLILSYFFPPCNLTAAQRSLGWARTLHLHGYYPVIITRNWEHHINSPDDMHHDSGSELISEQHEGYEVFYIPFRGNLRDRIYSKYGKSKYSLLRKGLSFLELIGHNYSNAAIPFSDIYDFANSYINSNKDVEAIVVTGNPFEIFRFGYLLNRKFNIPWIADYRDDWNTSEVNSSRGFADGILKKLAVNSEKRWIATASCITSISPYYAEKIASFTGRPGYVLLNGFFPEDYHEFRDIPLNDEFTVVYNGMLYPSQHIEVFLNAFKMLVDLYPQHRSKIMLRFPGIKFLKHVSDRVAGLMKGYDDVIELTERISRKEVLRIQASSHLLLMVAHNNATGIPSSKIYEYLGLGKPVLICPSDKNILEETFSAYNIGFIANSADDAFQVLNKLFLKFLDSSYWTLKADEKYTSRFTRDHQSEVLAKILDSTITNR